jgi:hypothetical protein
MQNSQFERLLKLSQKTGDRLIVTDPSGKEPVVILPLSEYEGLLDYKSFRRESHNEDYKERASEHVPEFAPQAMMKRGSEVIEDSSFEPEEETEGEFDPEALEEQVMAAMVMEEPEVVPVPQVRAPEPVMEEVPRKPIARRNEPKEGGEEQFYMEPV